MGPGAVKVRKKSMHANCSHLSIGFPTPGRAARCDTQNDKQNGFFLQSPQVVDSRTANSGAEIADPMCVDPKPAFLGLFAGSGGLSAAIRWHGEHVLDTVVLEAAQEVSGVDLASLSALHEVKSLLKRGLVRYVHLAPPWPGRARGQPGSTLNTLLANRTAVICRLALKMGCWFSVENPETSLIWQLPAMQQVSAMLNVQMVSWDMCCFGSEYKKGTSILTNAPWTSALQMRCPGPPRHPAHPQLTGKIFMESKGWVHRTRLAAEYPEGLCDAWARLYVEAVKTAGPLVPSITTVTVSQRVHNSADLNARQMREKENAECVGGLRNPNHAVALNPGLREVGGKLRAAISTFLDEYPGANCIVDWVGKPPTAQPTELISSVRAHLAHGLGVKINSKDGLQDWLLEAVVSQAADPDAEAASWVRRGTPLGIVEPIPPGGVFPQAVRAPDDPSLDTLEGAAGNYSSYEEHKKLADDEFRQELRAGFASYYACREDLQKAVGAPVSSPISVLVKTKNGKVKVRLVHDLRKSGVNARIAFTERVVLPLLQDAIASILNLMEARPSECISLVTLDFADAFKHLHVRDSEKRFLCGEILDGFFNFNTVLFGIRSGPLVWARMAALISRFSQALMRPHTARLQVFVDDPLVALCGNESEQRRELAILLWWWLACGLSMSWKKGSAGSCVEWIGTEISVDIISQAVLVSIPADKVRESLSVMRELLRKPIVARIVLRRWIGKLTWMAGIILQLRPFVRALYGVLYSRSPCKLGPAFVYRRQLLPQCLWVRSFLEGQLGGLRICWPLAAKHKVVLLFAFDANPTGEVQCSCTLARGTTCRPGQLGMPHGSGRANMHDCWVPNLQIRAARQRGRPLQCCWG